MHVAELVQDIHKNVLHHYLGMSLIVGIYSTINIKVKNIP